MLSVAGAVLVAAGGLVGVNQGTAHADATAPPPLNTAACPPAQAPPPGYPNPPPTRANPFIYNGHRFSGPIAYQIPFKGNIGSPQDAGGTLVVPPKNATTPGLVIPHVYGAVCGVLSFPGLVGTIPSGALTLAGSDTVAGRILPNVVNVYIGANPQLAKLPTTSSEALPVNVSFGTLAATAAKAPAHNGGLDVTVHGSTTAILDTSGSASAPNNPNTLGNACPVKIPDIPITTLTSGTLAGAPVTGPFHHAQAQVVSNDFPVPAAPPSRTCPPALAQAMNTFLGLPVKPGVATFKAPFTFDFEIEQAPTYNKDILGP